MLIQKKPVGTLTILIGLAFFAPCLCGKAEGSAYTSGRPVEHGAAGNVTCSNDPTNYALNFGCNHWAEVPDPADGILELTSDFTIEFWLYIDSLGPISKAAVSKHYSCHDYVGDWVIWISPWGQLFMQVPNYNYPQEYFDAYCSDTFNLSQWYHIAMVRDDATDENRFYVDGILSNIDTVFLPINDSPEPIRIGREGGGPSDERFAGKLDEVRLWNLQRTESEIKEHMCCSLSGTEGGLVGYWNFDEGAGQVINDSSPYGNNGWLGANQDPEGDPNDPEWVLSWIGGDANGDGVIDIGDIVYLTNYLYKITYPAPDPFCTGDVNCDGTVDLGDVVYLINYLYKSGPAPGRGCAFYSQGNSDCLGCNPGSSYRPISGPVQAGFAAGRPLEGGETPMMVEGSFDVDVAGVHLEFCYDSKALQTIVPELTNRTRDMNLFFGASDGVLKIGLVDLKGEHLISAGEGPLVKLKVPGSDLSSLAITRAMLVDGKASTFEAEIVARKETEAIRPSSFVLRQNYPNPFNPETHISYMLPHDGNVKLMVYSVRGQKVRTLVNGFQATGPQSVRWDGTDDKGNSVASGIYFYRIEAGEFIDTKKMMMLK